MRLRRPSARPLRRALGPPARLARRILGPPVRGVARAARVVSRRARPLTRAVLGVARPPARAGVSLVRRHPAVTTAAAAVALCLLVAWLLGTGLQQWFVAQGMDDERADLLSAMVLVLLATTVVTAVSRRPAPTRVGGLVGFVAIQIVPFLVRAATSPPTPGLRYTEDISGWILQPLGMLLLAVVSVLVGAALGVGLARDVVRLPSMVKRRRSWPVIVLAVALVVAASGAAVTALQDGPLSALHDYSVSSAPASPLATPAPTPTPNATAGPVAAIPTPNVLLLRQLPGEIQTLSISGHQVLVYVPGLYQADAGVSLPVLYLLHGTPGAPQQWITGGQIQGILDQLIAAGTIPPLLAVLPNGNEPNSNDTEWGNSTLGDVETWVVNQVVPAIDSQYRTLGAAFRGIAGFSSGGFGAVNLAIRNPTVFRWAGSYSGYFVGRSAIFGSAWRANSPLYTASALPAADRMPLYLGAGAQDYDFRPDTLQFATALRSIGWFDYELETVAGGHGWVAWNAELVQSLTWLGQLWGPEPWITPVPGPAGMPAQAVAGSLTTGGSL